MTPFVDYDDDGLGLGPAVPSFNINNPLATVTSSSTAFPPAGFTRLPNGNLVRTSDLPLVNVDTAQPPTGWGTASPQNFPASTTIPLYGDTVAKILDFLTPGPPTPGPWAGGYSYPQPDVVPPPLPVAQEQPQTPSAQNPVYEKPDAKTKWLLYGLLVLGAAGLIYGATKRGGK